MNISKIPKFRQGLQAKSNSRKEYGFPYSRHASPISRLLMTRRVVAMNSVSLLMDLEELTQGRL